MILYFPYQMSVHITVHYMYFDDGDFDESLDDEEHNSGGFVSFWEHIRMKAANLYEEYSGLQQATHMNLSSGSYDREPNGNTIIVVENLPFHKMNLDNVNFRGADRALSDSDAIKLVLFLHQVHIEHERERDIGDPSLIHSLDIWAS